MILLWVILDQKKNEKKYGKENLAMSMADRLAAYLFCVVCPVLLGAALAIGW